MSITRDKQEVRESELRLLRQEYRMHRQEVELLRKEIELLRKELSKPPEYITPIPIPLPNYVCPVCGKINCTEMHITCSDSSN